MRGFNSGGDLTLYNTACSPAHRADPQESATVEHVQSIRCVFLYAIKTKNTKRLDSPVSFKPK